MRMLSSTHAPETPLAWGRVFLYCSFLADGPAAGIRDGHFNATRLTAWLMHAGSATVDSRGAHGHAEKGQWLVCLPGVRDQTIDKSALYASLHFAVESPDVSAEWTGPAVHVFKTTPTLDRSLRRLQRTRFARYMKTAGLSRPQDVPSTVIDMLQFQECAASFFRELLVELASLHTFYSPLSVRDPRVLHSRQYLSQSDFRQHFSRQQFAEQYGLSPSQLDRLWRQELGITPQYYRDQCRLKRACSLLETGRHPIKEIAYMTGFHHLSRFCIWFRRKMGESPTSFRKRQTAR